MVDLHAFTHTLAQFGALPTLCTDWRKYPHTYEWVEDERYRDPAEVLKELARPGRSITAVGYHCGFGNWADFDIDEPQSNEPLKAVLLSLGLPDDYRWVLDTTSGGYRVFVRYDDPAALEAALSNTAVFKRAGVGCGQVEFRWRQGAQSVIAGRARRKDNNRIGEYRFQHGLPTEAPAVVSADRIVATIRAVTVEPEPEPAPKPYQIDTKPARPKSASRDNLSQPSGETVHNAARYLDSTIGEELHRVRVSQKGGRNNALFEAATRIASVYLGLTIAGATELDGAYNAALDDLRTIAVSAGLRDTEAAATVGSAVSDATPRLLTLATAQKSPADGAVGFDISSPDTLPDSFDDVLFACAPKQHAAGVARLRRAALVVFGYERFTLPALADKLGVARTVVWRAMERYGGLLFFERNESEPPERGSEALLQIDHHVLPTMYKPIDRTVTADSQSVYYRLKNLRTHPEITLSQIVTPYLTEKYLGTLAKATPDLLGVDDPNGDLSSAINTRIDAALTPAEKPQRQTTRNRAMAEYRQYEKRLQDTTSTALPELWKQDYAVARYQSKIALNKPISWHDTRKQTGIQTAAAKRIENKLNIIRDEQITRSDKVIALPEYLPTVGKFDKAMQGVPVRAVTDDGEILPYHDERQAHTVAQHIAHGGRVRIEYQTASIPRAMTADEITTRDMAKQEAREQRQSNPPTSKALPTPPKFTQEAESIAGYGAAFRLRWYSAQELLLGLPSIGTLPERAQRLAGIESEVKAIYTQPEREPDHDVIQLADTTKPGVIVINGVEIPLPTLPDAAWFEARAKQVAAQDLAAWREAHTAPLPLASGQD